MKTFILAGAAAAALGFAAPASAHDGAARGIAIETTDQQAQDFSSRHRHHWRRHHWRHHHWRHCDRFWRRGRLITVCG